MPDDFDRLNEIFGASGKEDDPAVTPGADSAGKSPLIRKLDEKLYDPEKHDRNQREQEAEEIEERDYRPIRRSRNGKIGCMGGLMYFVFVVSISIILACLGWMAATDVLALNKAEATAEVTLPQEIFTDKEVNVTDSEGKVTGTETVKSADIDYVARALKDNGIIQYKALFKMFCKVSHADTKLDPGTYELTTDYDYRALIKKMQTGSGAAVTVELTFPEGWTMDQIFTRLEENGVSTTKDLYDAAANYTYNYSFLEGEQSGDATRLEGYLFPDTYEFYVGMQASSAINKFLQNFSTKLTADMIKQAENRGMTIRQVMTVASMIEKEAGNNDERPIIASVIYNRLSISMPLGIDATSLYTHPEHEGAPTAEMLADASDPYNTRLNTGLTPTPICSPGVASIKAALQSADTGYYYYALDTATKLHQFFVTMEEFNAFRATQDYSDQ